MASRQGGARAVDLPARARSFDLARPGVAPPLPMSGKSTVNLVPHWPAGITDAPPFRESLIVSIIASKHSLLVIWQMFTSSPYN